MAGNVVYKMVGMTVALLNRDSVLKHITRQELKDSFLNKASTISCIENAIVTFNETFRCAIFRL